MDADEKTPVDGISPIERIVLDMGELRAEMRDNTILTQRTLDHVLEHHEIIKGIQATQESQDKRLTALERRRRITDYAPWLVAGAAIAMNLLR